VEPRPFLPDGLGTVVEGMLNSRDAHLNWQVLQGMLEDFRTALTDDQAFPMFTETIYVVNAARLGNFLIIEHRSFSGSGPWGFVDVDLEAAVLQRSDLLNPLNVALTEVAND
jgi:hypothetical protein